ncbi:MAG TPA: L,D-transpeptidase [Solirubrobacteraceae bacterium]|nr:L,D-transpeptidase [Solirubrobacteraceae bacterium]
MAVLAAVCAGVFVAPAAAGTVPGRQPLVALLHNHVARSAPDVHGHRIATIAGRRPLTRVRTVLPVLGQARSADGRAWIHVALPGRPNGHAGWIAADRTRLTSTGWRIAVKLGARRVTVYYFGHAVRRFRAVVGARSTPTPHGHFFIEEAVSLGARDAGGPFALATSARSAVLQEFDGGPGQIALHGIANLPGSVLGTASSHGCLRLGTRAITWLAQRIGAGVPLSIGR